jgi:hypothetical protein
VRSLDYLAGLFDGEGYIGISVSGGKGRPKLHYLVCSLGMIHEGAVEAFKTEFGGCVTRKEKTSSGKTLYRWKTSNENARQFLMEIRPCLFVKAEQAAVALEFCATRVRTRHLTDEEILRRETYRQRLAVLNGSTQAHRASVPTGQVRTRKKAA